MSFNRTIPKAWIMYNVELVILLKLLVRHILISSKIEGESYWYILNVLDTKECKIQVLQKPFIRKDLQSYKLLLTIISTFPHTTPVRNCGIGERSLEPDISTPGLSLF